MLHSGIPATSRIPGRGFKYKVNEPEIHDISQLQPIIRRWMDAQRFLHFFEALDTEKIQMANQKYRAEVHCVLYVQVVRK